MKKQLLVRIGSVDNSFDKLWIPGVIVNWIKMNYTSGIIDNYFT